MNAGLPVWQGGNESWRTWPHEQGEHTHVVFPRDEAAALIAVAEAARNVIPIGEPGLMAALDRLDAARTTTPRRDETRGET